MTTSVSAVVMSIISATSCAFVTFDHQYKTSSTAEGGRVLKDLKERVVRGWNLRRRVLNEENDTTSPLPEGYFEENGILYDDNGNPIGSSLSLAPGIQLNEPNPFDDEEEEQIIPGGEMNGEIPSVEEENEQVTAANIAAALNGQGNEDFDENGYPRMDDTTTPATPAVTFDTEPNGMVGGGEFNPNLDANGVPVGNDSAALPSNGPNSVGGDAMAETVAAPSDNIDTAPSNGPNSVGGDTMAETVAAASETNDTAPSNGPNSVGGDAMAETVAAPSDTTDTAPTNGPNSVGGDAMAETVAAPSDATDTTPSNGPNSVGGDPMAGAVPTGMDEDTEDVDFGPGSKGDSMAGQYTGESSTPQISGGGSIYGSSGYGSESTAASVSGASAIVKGDAGLFCDTDPSFTYTSLWNGGSVKAFEAEIASESDNNLSEEVSRNAGLLAVVVGALMAIILTIEFLMGRKMCLEKWIVGLLALVATGCQGATFAFFNSQRYCDGDILHEILNQEPCVLGKGGYMSIGSLLLYFFTIILVCKVPQDEPYGVCCRGEKNDYSERVFQGESESNGDLLMKSNMDDSKERPWVSEDKREEEENAII